jgi:hypothetical protein
MKKLFVITFMIVASLGYGQGFGLVEATPSQEERADIIADKLENVLGLTGKQEMLFSMCYAEFIAKENLVLTSDRSLNNKNRILKALYMEQGREIYDILTKPQRSLFKKVRGKYDPLIQLKE